jgi:hypothetical protein
MRAQNSVTSSGRTVSWDCIIGSSHGAEAEKSIGVGSWERGLRRESNGRAGCGSAQGYMSRVPKTEGDPWLLLEEQRHTAPIKCLFLIYGVSISD